MKWRKLGHIFCPRNHSWWALHHAIFPTAEVRENGLVRVYFTALDEHNFGRGGYVDLDSRNLTQIISVSDLPVLDLGPIGDFDDAGANPFSVVSFSGRKLMYYQGWQRTLRAPFAAFTGLAVETECGRFERWARTPVLERTNEEPHIRGAPFVIAENGKLSMWYVSSDTWSQRGDQLHYRVKIRHAFSTDGIEWTVHPNVCLSPQQNEYAVGRPVVLRDGGIYRMWYSIRSFDRPYSIGYAESDDGIHWIRKDDEVGIAASESGWDSEMICFGNVLRLDGRLLMFYNGNRHGLTGFGAAEFEIE